MQSCAIAHSAIRRSVDQHSGPVDGDETEDHGRRSSVTPSVVLGASQTARHSTSRARQRRVRARDRPDATSARDVGEVTGGAPREREVVRRDAVKRRLDRECSRVGRGHVEPIVPVRAVAAAVDDRVAGDSGPVHDVRGDHVLAGWYAVRREVERRLRDVDRGPKQRDADLVRWRPLLPRRSTSSCRSWAFRRCCPCTRRSAAGVPLRTTAAVPVGSLRSCRGNRSRWGTASSHRRTSGCQERRQRCASCDTGPQARLPNVCTPTRSAPVYAPRASRSTRSSSS